LLTFFGFGSLYSNFLYGQYYVFLLFVLTLAFYCLDRGRSTESGALSGLAFVAKLYGGPLLLYFLAKRNWKAAAGFAVAVLCGFGAAIALFGWGDVHYYATQILPRAMEGEIVNPYAAGNGTLTTLLRRLFVMDASLNPQPLWNAPMAFFFLRPFLMLSILGLTLLGLARKRVGVEGRDFAWFLVATLLLSGNTASYTFILLLLPVALLLKDAKPGEGILLLGTFFALCFPLRAEWLWAFPKMWILLALFLYVGFGYFRTLDLKLVAVALVVAAVFAAADARRHAVNYAAEPGRRYERVSAGKDAIFSASPTVSRAGLFYQSIGGDRYVLRWQHDGQTEELAFDGQAFHPTTASPDGPIYFELVAHGKSTTMAFDPVTRKTVPAPLPESAKNSDSAASPDAKWVAFESDRSGPKQIWLRNVATGATELLTGGNCNNSSPAWELDSSAVLFASDCGRGMGMPALYRAKIADQ
jgi:Glycosyltransferase family 87